MESPKTICPVYVSSAGWTKADPGIGIFPRHLHTLEAEISPESIFRNKGVKGLSGNTYLSFIKNLLVMMKKAMQAIE